MTPIPDVYDYAELGALAPDPADEECWCGRLYCGHDPIPWPAGDEREPVAREDR